MKTMGLPGRIAWAGGSFVVVGAAAFHVLMYWLPEYAANHPQYDPGVDGYGLFKAAVCVAASIALTAGLLVLTMPGVRHRKRRGRGRRIALTCVGVVTASLVFADQGFRLPYDVLFATWLAYMMAFTFVRYGVTDEARRSSSREREY